MNYQNPILALAWISLFSTTPVDADWRDEIGFTRLQLLAGSELPTAPSQGLTQIEAPENGANYLPDSANTLFSGKTFVAKTSATGVSNHATHVATNFYGATSQLPGACSVDIYNVNQWLYSDFLKTGTSNLPAIESRAIQNHSWVGGTASDTEMIRRLDYAIHRDGFVCVVGSDNENSTTLPILLSHAYNAITVGRDDGGHSAGLTTVDGVGRIKPDIVAPSTNPEYATSWTTPMVAGSAGLLYTKLAAAPYSIVAVDRARVVKSLLLASATKNTLPTWSNNATSPLDSVYGAGELNIYHAYNTLRAGKATASTSVQYGLRGWATESITSSTVKSYYFNIPLGATSSPLTGVLTWNRIASKTGSNTWNSSLANLSLRLYHANGFIQGTEVASSTSQVDNLELIHQPALSPGTYVWVVQSASATSTSYALAWHSLPTVTIVASIPTAKEINGQAGQFTVTRTGDTTLPLLVPLTRSGSAISGTHFQPIPNTLTILAGQASGTLTVTPIADSLAQGSRSVIVAIGTDFALIQGNTNTANVTIEDKPFDTWRFENFAGVELTNPSISGDLVDPDGDSLANLTEYAFDLPPKTPSISQAQMSIIGGYLALSATKNINATDITWDAQVTQDFISWAPTVIITNTSTAFTARDQVPKSTYNKRFIRLKITRP